MELRQTKKYQCKKKVELELYFKEVGKLKEEKKGGHFYMANRLCQKCTGGNIRKKVSLGWGHYVRKTRQDTQAVLTLSREPSLDFGALWSHARAIWIQA